MKIMYFRGYFVTILSVLPVIASQKNNLQAPFAAFNSYETSLFVDSTSGQDTKTCGSKGSPCSTISYAVQQAVNQSYSSVLINISAGSYKELNSFKLDCSRWKLKRIALWGERKDKQVVQVDFSLDTQLCEVNLINMHWTKCGPALHNIVLSNLSICESTMQESDFSIIGSSSNIILQNCKISNSSGYQKWLPLLSVTSIPGHRNMLQIMYCTFSHNIGPLISVANIYQASITNSDMEGNNAYSDTKLITSQFSHLNISSTRFVQNSGSLLGVQNSGTLNISGCQFQLNELFGGSVVVMEGMTSAGVKDCVFQDSNSSSEGPVMRIVDSHSSAHFEGSNFSCNMVNRSKFLPPVTSPHVYQVSCDNCFVNHHCPVLCSPGEFLSSFILCKSCPPGSYSPGVTGNKTVAQCASCPTGTYSSKERTKVCTPCAEGTFTSKTGSILCSKCKNDFLTSRPGQASCSKFTVEFIVLIVLVSLFTFVPLMLLLLQSKQCAKTKNRSFSIQSGDISPLQRRRNKGGYSIQNGGYGRSLVELST